MKVKFLMGLAWKNLTRYKRRTFITVIVLAVGITCYLLLDSILIGAREESEENLQRYEVGAAKMVTPEYWEDRREVPLKESIENPGAVIEQLKGQGIEAVARIPFDTNVVVKTGIGGSFPARVTAIDVEQDSRVFQILDSVKQGRIPASGEDAILIGSWMAVDFGLEIGDLINLQIVDREGGNDAMELEIVGLVDSPNPVINLTGMFISLKTAEYYLYMENRASEIVLSWPSSANKRNGMASAQRIADQMGLELHPWQDWSKEYMAASEGDKYGSFIILLLIFVIAAVGFSNTLLMSLLERVPETGMMRALGCSKSEIMLLFLMESLLIGLLGSLVGMALAALFNIPMVRTGIDVSMMMRDMGNVGYRFTGIMYGVWDGASFIKGFLGGMIIALAVSFSSILKALRLEIVDSIRG